MINLDRMHQHLTAQRMRLKSFTRVKYHLHGFHGNNSDSCISRMYVTEEYSILIKKN